jgi:hypothetical protein
MENLNLNRRGGLIRGGLYRVIRTMEEQILKRAEEMTDFPKTVGPDRQKCSRTDDFKIYIGPNVR